MTLPAGFSQGIYSISSVIVAATIAVASRSISSHLPVDNSRGENHGWRWLALVGVGSLTCRFQKTGGSRRSALIAQRDLSNTAAALDGHQL